ncbi:2094_t:CDS:2 [Ambispora leptoticha]|uniref:Large ribosomal subunit protein mL44 n=1 Tax=Ambispora leptoticha TaxID=144679 RepID=A0A9N8VEK6_9GLOM|nr:2094_t:CDS:2 [Ambispora leptoticha]
MYQKDLLLKKLRTMLHFSNVFPIKKAFAFITFIERKRLARNYFHTFKNPLFDRRRKLTQKPYAPITHEKDTITPSLSALGARLRLSFSNPELLLQVVTDESYQNTDYESNKTLSILGEHVCRLFVTEYFHIKYPLMPLPALEEVIKLYTGQQTLLSFGKEVGLSLVIRWEKITDLKKAQQSNAALPLSTTPGIALMRSIHAIVGALYQDKGPLAARNFVHSYLLSREVKIDLVYEKSCAKLPKRELSLLMQRQGKIPPISRMLKETGRNTNSPIFIVGVFSGTEKIGEGYGSNIKMAEFRAARDALKSYYLTEIKDFILPSDVVNEDVEYGPTEIGDTPVIV